MHVLLNTRAAAHDDEQGTANKRRRRSARNSREAERDRPWAAKQQAVRLIWPGDFIWMHTTLSTTVASQYTTFA